MTISMTGQWKGFFEYGTQYGDKLSGEKVEFRLFLKHSDNGEFEGTCADLEGMGSSFEVSKIRGFTDHTFISFTKEYEQYHSIDEEGNLYPQTTGQRPRLSYNGQYDKSTNSFRGNWEIISNERLYFDGSLVQFSTGIWEMMKDE
jgi:hypothetical protein